ncbi:unnamed protein product, partial [Mesorhabditis spiculigera]
MFGILNLDTTKLKPWEWAFFFVILGSGLMITPIGLFLNYWERNGKSRRFQRRVFFHLQEKALLKLAKEHEAKEKAGVAKAETKVELTHSRELLIPEQSDLFNPN